MGIFCESIQTVRKWSDIKDNIEKSDNKRKVNLMPVYSISPLAFVDLNFVMIGLGILAVASLENYLGSGGNGFLAEKIGGLVKVCLPIAALYFVIKLLTSNAMLWWL